MDHDPSTHPAAWPIDRLLAECDVRRGRGSGPGGQRRNKVETAVTLTHRPSGVTAQASERRSQAENHRAAAFRLRVNLALAVRGEGRESTRGPSPLWSARVRDGRLAVNPTHDDFPALLAEALDRLGDRGHDVPAAASDLGVNASQLIKLLRHEPRALVAVNAARQAEGRTPLR
ncbi:MAG: peptide chain release factor-like protein [Planctomycetota bacterium]